MFRLRGEVGGCVARAAHARELMGIDVLEREVDDLGPRRRLPRVQQPIPAIDPLENLLQLLHRHLPPRRNPEQPIMPRRLHRPLLPRLQDALERLGVVVDGRGLHGYIDGRVPRFYRPSRATT